MAIDGESYENLTMYPDFAQIAKDEGHKEAARLFTGGLQQVILHS